MTAEIPKQGRVIPIRILQDIYPSGKHNEVHTLRVPFIERATMAMWAFVVRIATIALTFLLVSIATIAFEDRVPVHYASLIAFVLVACIPTSRLRKFYHFVRNIRRGGRPRTTK